MVVVNGDVFYRAKDGLRSFVNQTAIRGVPLAQTVKRADFDLGQLPPEVTGVAPADLWRLVVAELKYEGYIRRQEEQNRRLRNSADHAIPDGFDFDRIPGLRRETRQRLSAVRPTSTAAIQHIRGITSADASIMRIWLSSNDIRSGEPAQLASQEFPTR